MKFSIQNLILINKAPIDKLILDFNENEIAVLTAINGKGKTTILSYIVDAFYEIAKPHFHNEFAGKESKFYRISSSQFNLYSTSPSFVYIRFKYDGENYDYLEVREKCSEDQYLAAIQLENKIPYNEFSTNLNNTSQVKKLSNNFNSPGIITKIFSSNIITYFPSYRFETPGYLNSPYKIVINFNKESQFAGFLDNPIEVVSVLPKIANWIMDITLDLRSYFAQENRLLFENINFILSNVLLSKNHGPISFGIGPRGLGSTRLQIVDKDQKLFIQVYLIYHLVNSLLCVFF